MYTKPNQVDNLLNRVSRLYIDDRQFMDESGKNVEYQRLVLQIVVKDKTVNIEAKLDSKDYILLDLADTKESTL